MIPKFFSDPGKFRTWLERHHASATELWVGFHKKASGKIAMTYAEAVDEALCFGWIDGIIKRLDADSYMHRFSPRKKGSIWSNLNVGHVDRLTKTGRMHPAGLAAFAARDAAKTGVYSFESNRPLQLPPDSARRFRANPAAWAFFTAQAPSYQHGVRYKIITAKLEATRERWLTRAIAASAAGRRL